MSSSLSQRATMLALALFAACGSSSSPHEHERMIFVPEGVYKYGARDPDYVAAFAIDRDEVSEADYARCVADRGCVYRTGQRDTPARVTWDGARTFCAWRGARLPTEIEWEVAARGRENRRYPWGDTMIHDCDLVGHSQCVRRLVNEPTLDVSPFGARNLFGNVEEWVADLARRGSDRVVRGLADERGFADFSNREWATSANWDRRVADPTLFHGFRCARSLAVKSP